MDNLDKKIKDELNKDEVMPENIRKRLNNTYKSIEDKKPRKFPYKAIAGTLVIAASIAFFSTTSFAEIKSFFGFKDEAISKAVEKGFVSKGTVQAVDSGVGIRFLNQTGDKSKVALEFEMVFDDKNFIKDKTYLFVEYRVRDSKGNYVIDCVSDDKEFKVKEHVTSGGGIYIISKNEETGVLRGSIEINSNIGKLPNISNGIVEIISIGISNPRDESSKIVGDWKLPVNIKKSTNHINYRVVENKGDIKVSGVKSSELATNIVIDINREVKNENDLFHGNLYIEDKNGKRYYHDGCMLYTENGKARAHINFDLSSYENLDEFKVYLKGYGEASVQRELTKK
ncbi:MAG: hypothetical protein RSA01_05060 [Clostridium sp.]